MQYSSILATEPAFDFDSAFQFKSAFKYSRIAGNEDDYGVLGSELSSDQPPDTVYQKWYQKLIRSLFIVTSYSAVIATLPISFWFCVKKVKALERCVIFRLGQRLPLQGPGYVVTFPCFDVLDVIDLSPQTFCVTDDEQHILTSDGSIVQLKNFEVTIAVSDAVKSFTQIKDSKANIQKFVKLAFQNVLSGSHIEDLERKIDWIIKGFVQSCSKSILKWGWEITDNTMPKVIIISRAEPSNPLVETLKSYFSGESGKGTGVPGEVCIQVDSDPVPDPYAAALQSVAFKFTALQMLGIACVTLSLEIRGEPIRFYRFTTSSGKVEPLHQKVDDVDVQIRAPSVQQFGTAIQTNDLSLIEIVHNLF